VSYELTHAPVPISPAPERATTAATPRVWPVLILLALYWPASLALRWSDLPMFVRFMSMLGTCALLLLLFVGWWLAASRVRWLLRFAALGAWFLGGAAAAALVGDPQMAFGWLLFTLPWGLTIWAAWMVLARWVPPGARASGLFAVILLTWAGFSLVIVDGLWGGGEMQMRWRWVPSSADDYSALIAGEGTKTLAPQTPPLKLQAGDWPGFRGPERNSRARGAKVADWNSSPPKQLWSRRIGGGWSSVVVIGDKLFTQEQRGDNEAVVCLDAATGKNVWIHEDPGVHFYDGQSSHGPRATPTFADGKLYTLGAKGLLSCFNAATGERLWYRDVLADSGHDLPMWGFANSPAVVSGRVIVYAPQEKKGDDDTKCLLAYDAATGAPSWQTAVGNMSYGSPQPATLGGVEQVLFLSNRGLTATDPATGALLWEFKAPMGAGQPRSLQPQVVGEGEILISSEADFGTALIDVKREGNTWSATRRWVLRQMKPSFNDWVVHDGFAYGFSGGSRNLLGCIEIKTGKLQWKGEEYGFGQALLLPDQPAVLVVSERGQVILVATDPKAPQELGSIQALSLDIRDAKTWNHPVIAHGRLYVRNNAEIACYDLGR
jgi:hypothetical protein